MQYRRPVGAGPSGKTWPRWPPQLAHRTSVRRIPCDVSSRVSTLSSDDGSKKLGQPEPEWNLVSERKSSAPQPHAAIDAGILGVDVGAGERALGACLTEHVVLLRRQAVTPLLFGEIGHALSVANRGQTDRWTPIVIDPVYPAAVSRMRRSELRPPLRKTASTAFLVSRPGRRE